MELERPELTTAAVLERRRHARRMADKIAQLHLTRVKLSSIYDNWVAIALEYTRAHPLIAIGAAFAAGYMLSRVSRSRSD